MTKWSNKNSRKQRMHNHSPSLTVLTSLRGTDRPQLAVDLRDRVKSKIRMSKIRDSKLQYQIACVQNVRRVKPAPFGKNRIFPDIGVFLHDPPFPDTS